MTKERSLRMAPREEKNRMGTKDRGDPKSSSFSPRYQRVQTAKSFRKKEGTASDCIRERGRKHHKKRRVGQKRSLRLTQQYGLFRKRLACGGSAARRKGKNFANQHTERRIPSSREGAADSSRIGRGKCQSSYKKTKTDFHQRGPLNRRRGGRRPNIRSQASSKGGIKSIKKKKVYFAGKNPVRGPIAAKKSL